MLLAGLFMVKPIIKWTLERHAVSGQPQGLPLQDVYLFLGSTIVLRDKVSGQPQGLPLQDVYLFLGSTIVLRDKFTYVNEFFFWTPEFIRASLAKTLSIWEPIDPPVEPLQFHRAPQAA